MHCNVEAKLAWLYSSIELHAVTQGQHKTQRNTNYKQAGFLYKCPFKYEFWHFKVFRLCCRKFAITPVYAPLCKIYAQKNSGRVNILTNIMSGIHNDKANWMNWMRQRPKLAKVFQEFMLDMKRNTCTLYIFKSFCKQKTGAQRGRILFTQTFEFTSSFHQNAHRISSSNSKISF